MSYHVLERVSEIHGVAVRYNPNDEISIPDIGSDARGYSRPIRHDHTTCNGGITYFDEHMFVHL